MNQRLRQRHFRPICQHLQSHRRRSIHQKSQRHYRLHCQLSSHRLRSDHQKSQFPIKRYLILRILSSVAIPGKMLMNPARYGVRARKAKIALKTCPVSHLQNAMINWQRMTRLIASIVRVMIQVELPLWILHLLQRKRPACQKDVLVILVHSRTNVAANMVSADPHLFTAILWVLGN